MHNLINKLVLAAIIFHLWQERNRRLFQREGKSDWQIIADIEDDVREKLMGLFYVHNQRVCTELLCWGVIIELPSIQIQ